MDGKKYCVIMAGGIGSRFWPISRNSRPKQFLDILGTGKTFIRSTFERFLPIIPLENFLIVTNAAYVELVKEQIPELKPEQILGEPIGRNTAPCIAYAAFRLRAMDPWSTMIITPSDHYIADPERFREVILESVRFAECNDTLMTIGIKPDHPNTGYGYIQIEADANSAADIRQVRTFTEKPNAELAAAFVESGDFYWNSGIFIWKTEAIIREFEKHLPETYQLFQSISPYYNTPLETKNIEKIYSQCRGVSIDIGIMENADNVHIYCGKFGWSDIGTWGSLYQYSDKDKNGNVSCDTAIMYDMRGCIVKSASGKQIVIEGLEDFIVVDCDDVLMICPRTHEQNIKKYIDEVRFRNGDKSL